MQFTDEYDNKAFNLRIHTEMNFTEPNQAVEKNDFDFTSDQTLVNHNEGQLESCFIFKGSLARLNNVFDKRVWARSTEDFLRLPKP